MRLIDANALREKAEVIIDENYDDYVVVYAEDVDNAPTIDAVEVVRCKDCAYSIKHHTLDDLKLCGNDHWNDDFYPVVCDNDFCSQGKRREENAAD